MADHSKDKGSDLSLDSITEDLFGLNIRGLQTIQTVWRQPKSYFAAARTPDWQNKFTPSIRLWLSFFAVFSALKFWWFGKNESMVGAFAEGFANAGLVLPDGVTYQDIGAETVMWVFGWVPVIQIVSMVLLSCIYTAWGERTTLALRQRYLFAVLIPSASVMPIFLTGMLFVPPHLLSVYGIGLALAALLIDFQAGYRGAFQTVSPRGRLWRAGLLALIVVLINTTTAIVAQIVGIILTNQKYAVALPG